MRRSTAWFRRWNATMMPSWIASKKRSCGIKILPVCWCGLWEMNRESARRLRMQESGQKSTTTAGWFTTRESAGSRGDLFRIEVYGIFTAGCTPPIRTLMHTFLSPGRKSRICSANLRMRWAIARGILRAILRGFTIIPDLREGLCGSGATTESIWGKRLAARKYTITEEIPGSFPTMSTFAWMGWYIPIAHRTPGFWSTATYCDRCAFA